MDAHARLAQIGLEFPALVRSGAKTAQGACFGGSLFYAFGIGPLDGGIGAVVLPLSIPGKFEAVTGLKG